MGEDKNACLENRKKQRSIACLLFDIFGFILLICAILLCHIIPLWAMVVLAVIGIGLCCAGIVYAVLCYKVCGLTGVGITSVILSIFGMAFGCEIITIFAIVYMLM